MSSRRDSRGAACAAWREAALSNEAVHASSTSCDRPAGRKNREGGKASAACGRGAGIGGKRGSCGRRARAGIITKRLGKRRRRVTGVWASGVEAGGGAGGQRGGWARAPQHEPDAQRRVPTLARRRSPPARIGKSRCGSAAVGTCFRPDCRGGGGGVAGERLTRDEGDGADCCRGVVVKGAHLFRTGRGE
eukprot:scaffold2639_cov95-Isochrysis_galbana.AAC.8